MQHSSHWAKGVTGLCSFLETLGGNQFPCLFLLQEASCIPWLIAPSRMWTPAHYSGYYKLNDDDGLTRLHMALVGVVGLRLKDPFPR